MAITYNAGTNTITVTGYTEATPCNFTDIYNADVAGGWGVFTRLCLNSFCSNAFIGIGDGSTATWFADTEKTLIFPASVITANLQSLINITNNSNFILGELVNDSNVSTAEGCTIISLYTTQSTYSIKLINGESTGNVYLYGCFFIGHDLGTSHIALWFIQNGKIYNAVLSCIDLAVPLCTLKNINVTKGLFGISADYANNFTVRGLRIRDTISTVGAYHISTHSHIIDADVVGAWTINWYGGGAYVGKLYREYSFDLKVVDKDNSPINTATVKIWDKDSNLVVDTTTDANGVITTQTITRGYYNSANGNTLQESTPHLIKIEKAGYTTYEADFTLGDKTDWLIALQTASILRNPSMSGGMR